MKKVSVIVTAYNSSATLARCLGSLVHQTLDDIEIVVVNDASTDDTLDIMSRCKEQFPEKIVVIDGKVNRGNGGAINQGLDAATGEYIGFVDSDDYVTANMFELLYSKAKEQDADIVDCGIYLEQTDSAILYAGDNVIGDLDGPKRSLLIYGSGYLVSKIFKKELFETPKKIRLREHIRCLQDNDILKYMFLRAKNIWNVKEICYNYSDTPGSATKLMDVDTYYESIYGVMEATYRLCHDMDAYKDCLEMIEFAQIRWYSYGINRCLYDNIQKYGAGTEHISSYFDNLSPKESRLLSELAKLRSQIISCSYRDNPQVVKEISELDICIMEECDQRFQYHSIIVSGSHKDHSR